MAYFTGKRAAITGAGSGMGRALARQLNEAGCELWLSDFNEAGLGETVASLNERAAPVYQKRVDVADREAVESWAEEVAATVPSLELMVNNAGVAFSGLVRDMSYEDFHWVMDIDFWGVVHGSKAFLPLLEKAEKSHLVNTSSVFGMISVPSQSAYNSAKFAVRGFTEALRQELDLANSPVKVCCVHPGGVGTNIARSARSVDPADSADVRDEMFKKYVKTSAEEAARQILAAAQSGQRRLLIGSDAKWLSWITRLFPASYHRFFESHTRALLPDK
ncbi:MAG: SDR family NAD(P)-dependent oxidoreductase [Pseudomonadota bacterium]